MKCCFQKISHCTQTKTFSSKKSPFYLSLRSNHVYKLFLVEGGGGRKQSTCVSVTINKIKNIHKKLNIYLFTHAIFIHGKSSTRNFYYLSRDKKKAQGKNCLVKFYLQNEFHKINFIIFFFHPFTLQSSLLRQETISSEANKHYRKAASVTLHKRCKTITIHRQRARQMTTVNIFVLNTVYHLKIKKD